MPVLTNLHFEVIKGVLVDVLHLVHKTHGVVSQSSNVRAADLIIGGVVQARRGHIRAPDGLNFLQLTKLILADDLRRTGRNVTRNNLLNRGK